MKGWQAYPGALAYNTISLGGAAVVLHDENSPYFSPLIGNYSAVLFNGIQPPVGDGLIAEIGQTGTIPVGTLSLRFVATSLSPVVSFGGNAIAVQQVGSTARYNVFAGDISSFAGQTGELRFSQTGLFDQVTFSTVAVPEPATMALLLAGAVLLSVSRRLRQ